jgi:GNAT superfamily N-acetyltransferase
MTNERDDWLFPGWQVRAAQADDAVQLTHIERRAREPMVHARGGPAWLRENPPVGDWTSLIHGDCVAVATIDHVVLGYLHLEGPDVTGVARVRQVFVEPEARGLGFGDMLLAFALDQARAMAAVTLDGEALPGDRETKNLYERAHITARKIIVSTTL